MSSQSLNPCALMEIVLLVQQAEIRANIPPGGLLLPHPNLGYEGRCFQLFTC